MPAIVRAAIDTVTAHVGAPTSRPQDRCSWQSERNSSTRRSAAVGGSPFV